MLRAFFLLSTALSLGGAAFAAEPPPLSVYAADPAISQVTLSPDGRRAAYLGTVEARRTVQVMDKAGAVSAVLAGTAIDQVKWGSDRHLLVFSTGMFRGNESLPKQPLTQLNIVNLSTGKTYLALGDARDAVPIVAGGGTIIGGQTYRGAPAVYFRVLRAGPSFDLFRVDLDTGRGYLHDPGSFDAVGWVVTPTGELVAKTAYDPARGSWTLSARRDAEWKALRTESTRSPPYIEGLGQDLNSVTAKTDDGWTELSLTDGGPAPEAAGWREVIHVEYATKSGRLVAVELSSEKPTYRFFDPALATAWKRASGPFRDKIVELRSFSDDYSKLILFVSGPDEPGAYYWVDLNSGRAELIDKTRESLKPDQIGPFRMVDYRTGDGLSLSGLLTLPPGRARSNLPLIVLVRDEVQGRDRLGFDWAAQAYASRGYAVFQPNVRGSSLSMAVERAGDGELGRAMQTDLKDGVAALARQGVIDPKRACIVGQAYGGYMALAAVTLQSGTFRCAVAIDAPSDLPRLLESPDRYARGAGWDRVALLQRLTGAKGPGDPRARAVSPLAQATHASAPILLIHGEDDTRIEPSQSRRMQAALKAAGKSSELQLIKGFLSDRSRPPNANSFSPPLWPS